MNALLPAVVPSLAWALLDFVWQGLLVGWGAALLLGLLRSARPQTRYAVACAALLLCAALPLAGTLQRIFDADSATTSLMPLALAVPLAAATDAPAALAGARLALWEQALQSRLPLVMLLWSAGAGALALRMLLGLLWVRRLSHPANCRPDPAWQGRVQQLAERFGINRPVRLGLVDDVPGPLTAGWWRPVILLPASVASGMPVHLLEALLAHELAHIRRHDYLVNLVQSAIEVVLFYHPAVWWLSKRIRLEREQVADDLAAGVLGEPRRLALALSELDRFQLSTTPQLAHAAHGGNLMNRIKRLVRPESEPLHWKMALPILGLACACAAFYANAQPSPSPQPRTEKTISVRGGTEQAYALVRPGERGTQGSGSSSDWKAIAAAKRAIPGQFLWFRDAGKAYVVSDPAVLAKVVDAWAPVERLGDEMDVFGREMEQHGKVMESLGRQMEREGRQAEQAGRGQRRHSERAVEALGRDQERLGRQMEKLGRDMERADSAQRETLNRKMDELGKQMRMLGRQMEQQSDALSREEARQTNAPMAELGRQMEDAGKPMDSLGKKMDVLGKQIDAEARVAERTMRALIRDAMAKGLAAPAPAA
ncbi:peptidase M56 [Massilia eurypsychrophila]|jgi:beta-lactamase regulating signal transducer with metallopeptidase domain|uniref:Peptidase M56 n=1 Tax=Massilia eurypsychrophila TaxID=1485217 RepID=A0A2G8TH93_9BURK|nr:M56 family metallopeptidase [Massilia eurypsychrophila]PIL45421.1 peptidase M56 [Massilia eurypsychrophila]